MKQALIVVDMQRFYFEGENAAAQERLPAALECANLAIAAYAAAGRPVILARTLHKPDQSTWTRKMRETGRAIMLEGSEEAADAPGLLAPPMAFSLVKTRHSAFTATGLAEDLAAMDVESVAICGAFTESCVALTAIDAVQHDFHAAILRDASVALNADLGASVLDYCRREFDIALLDCAEAARAAPLTLSALL